MLPCTAAIGGFEKAASSAAPFSVLPRPLPRRPQNRVDDLRITRIEFQIHRAGVLIFIENLLPAFAAIGRSEHSALNIRTIGMPQHGNEDPIGIARVHQNRRNLLAIAEPQMAPALARVGGFINSIAHREVRPLHALAAADINNVRVGRRQGNRAHGTSGLLIEYRMPGTPKIVRLPDPAIGRRNIEHIRLASDTCGSDGAPAAERPNHPPAQPGKVRSECLRSQRYRAQKKVKDSMHGRSSLSWERKPRFSFLVSRFSLGSVDERETRNEKRPLPAILIFALTYLVLAIGRLPGLRVDRTGAAIIGASLMVAVNALTLDRSPAGHQFRHHHSAVRNDDRGRKSAAIRLLLAGGRARGGTCPSALLLLIAIVAIAGFFSAFFVNDTMCLVLTPLVLEITETLRRNPVPYLLAVAMASNIGSVATITGNPQNMMIGSFSGIPYSRSSWPRWRPLRSLGWLSPCWSSFWPTAPSSHHANALTLRRVRFAWIAG